MVSARADKKKIPRYAAILATLRDEIAVGVHTVGELLPSEAALCQKYCVSRFTVREALRRLESEGILLRTQGAGSRVLRASHSGVFVQSYHSASDLAAYASATKFELIGTENRILRPEEAERIQARDRAAWCLMSGIRREFGGLPLAVVESFVQQELAEIAIDLAKGPGPICDGLAVARGEPILKVVQETQALPAPERVANILNIAVGAPALRILRRYDTASGVLIASFNWHRGGDGYIHRTNIDIHDD